MVGVRNAMVIMGILYGLVYLSACSASGSMGDHFSMTATPEGMRAFADLSNGLIRTGKESAEQPSQYINFRAKQEAEITQREATGFWQKLTQ